MCGIAGIVYFDKNRLCNLELIKDLNKSLSHRGPDGDGHYLHQNIGFGHTRLSIIDLSSNATQPMVNGDKTLCITFNGEIYNYKTLQKDLAKKGHIFRTQSDTEVILHLYRGYGEKCVDFLEGMFAFAIHDLKNDRVFIARDRLGIKPLYYYRDPEKFIFASEIKAILKVPAVNVELDYKAFYHYLQFMSVPTPETIYKNIRKLEPGFHFTLAGQREFKNQYWDISNTASNKTWSKKEIEQRVEESLNNSVQSHLVADVPVGAFLSGGLDSSSVVALASQHQKSPVETFSITFKNDKKYNEAPFAQEVSKFCHTNHHEFDMEPNFINVLPKIVKLCDEPFAISSSIALYLLSQETAKNVKVVLTGDGGDEVFAGYPRHYKARALPVITNNLPHSFKTLLNHSLNAVSKGSGINTNSHPVSRFFELWDQLILSEEDFFQKELSTFSPLGIRGILDKSFYNENIKPCGDLATPDFYNSKENLDEVNRKLYTDIKTSLVDEMLTKVDRMTMAHGLEARVPFLDHRLVELAFQIPGSFKHTENEGKTLLRSVMAKHLPGNIINRSKWGFNVPLNNWFSGELYDFLRDHLSEKALRKNGVFNPKAVDQLLSDHKKGVQDNSNKLFEILTWTLWTESQNL